MGPAFPFFLFVVTVLYTCKDRDQGLPPLPFGSVGFFFFSQPHAQLKPLLIGGMARLPFFFIDRFVGSFQVISLLSYCLRTTFLYPYSAELQQEEERNKTSLDEIGFRLSADSSVTAV